MIAEFDALVKQYDSVAGFEANGGFLLGSDTIINDKTIKALPTRDAVLPALMLLALAKEKPIYELVNALPQRFTHSDRIQNFATEISTEILEIAKQQPDIFLQQLDIDDPNIKCIDETDGLRITLVCGDIIHFRSSGNAPEFRCYVETKSYESSRQILNNIIFKLTRMNTVYD